MRFGRYKNNKTFYMNAKAVVILLFDKLSSATKQSTLNRLTHVGFITSLKSASSDASPSMLLTTYPCLPSQHQKGSSLPPRPLHFQKPSVHPA